MDAAQVYQCFVGIDIAATTATAVVLLAGGRLTAPLTIPQTAPGYATLQRAMLTDGVVASRVLVVLEATGSYWISLATILAHAGFAISVINPAQAHHFAKALLTRDKTDSVDALTLAHLAARLQPAPWTPPPAIYHDVQQRLAERDQVIALRQQVRNQLHALCQQPVVVTAVEQRMRQLIATFNAQITILDRELAVTVHHDTAWALSVARLQTIPGIGLLSATWLLVATLNFSLCPSAEAAAAYAGLVPCTYESGSSVRRRARIGHTGHGRLRAVLYMVTLSAAQHNPAIKAFYTRLRAAGKPHKVARCAAARKLLHIVWAVATKGVVFDPTYLRHQGSSAHT